MTEKTIMPRASLYEVSMYDPETGTRAFLVIDTL